MDPKDILVALRNGWWLIVLSCLIGVLAGGALTLQATPRYTSMTTLFVSATGTDDTATAYQGNLFSQQRVMSYVELVKGAAFVAPVIDQLGLEESPADLIADIQVAAVPDTVLLRVSVTRDSPVEARDIASALGTEFSQRVAALEKPEGASTAPVKVTITEPPLIADSPSSPNLVRNLAIGLLGGLLLGNAVALVRERLDNTVKATDDIPALAGAGLVGTLVEDPALRDNHLVSDEDGYSETGEAYRQVRTNLQFLDVDDPARTIVVTSSLPGEGKTTVTVNLAIVLAQSGARVTLIEADLRRPRVTRYLGMISGAGLSNVLAGNADVDELLQPFGDGKLSVLAAGPMPPNPSEMLGSQQMRGLLEELSRHNDYVLIDAPPLLPVTDAAVLSANCDGAILVAHHGVTTRAQFAQAAGTLHRIEARLLGVVLNRVPPKAAEAYGYGYSYSASAEQLTGQFTAIGARSNRRRPPVPTSTNPVPPLPSARR